MTGGNLAALLGLDQVPYRMKQTNQRKKDTGEKKNLVGGEGTRKRKFMQCLQRDNDPATIKRMLSDPGEMTTRALRTNKKRNLTQKKKKKKERCVCRQTKKRKSRVRNDHIICRIPHYEREERTVPVISEAQDRALHLALSPFFRKKREELKKKK